MSGPPKDVTPEDLWRKLNETPAPSQVVDFPRYENGKSICRVRIMLLPQAQHDACREAAFNRLTKQRKFKPEDLANIALQEVYGDAIACELLARACVSENPIEGSEATGALRYQRLFRDADMIREGLTSDEVLVLWTAYRSVQHKFGPYHDSVRTQAEVTEWIDRLALGAAGADPFRHCSWPALLELAALLAQRVCILSSILESQLESLPPTIRSALETSPLGITSVTWPPVKCTETSLSLEPLDRDEDDVLPVLTDPNEPELLLEDAIRIARTLTP
jgi:hypothetical protein